MKTIVIGDIHGCFDELRDLIAELKESEEYNVETDRLIFLGDYIDRGIDSRKVIKFIRELQENNDNVIALMGNHEDMLVEYYNAQSQNWLYNGYDATLKSYDNNLKQLFDDINWIKSLPLYYEDEHFVYVHAGIDPTKPLDEQSKNELLWVREDFIYTIEKFNKRVIFGHTPSLAITGETKPYMTYTDNVGIDTGCVFNGKLTALIIEDSEVTSYVQIEKENKDLEGEKNYESENK
jgi:serine/threonine protein phosphatase 1